MDKETEKINSHFLKLAGKAELPKEISIGHNFKVILNGSVTAYTLSDNHDGTYSKMYKFEPIALEIITDTGESLKLKDTRSASTKFRACVWKNWKDDESDWPFDDYYQNIMGKLIQNYKEIISMFG